MRGGRFSFQANNAYRNERSTATLNVPYYVTDDFEEHYSEGPAQGVCNPISHKIIR